MDYGGSSPSAPTIIIKKIFYMKKGFEDLEALGEFNKGNLKYSKLREMIEVLEKRLETLK